jgi:tetratricopeptide (TPR) repeat protein
MLCQFFKAVQLPSKSLLRAILILSVLLIVFMPMVVAQSSASTGSGGEISGTVFWSGDNNRPAAQVIVSLKSDPTGVSRSILTDLEGRFAVSGLPAGAYDVVAAEVGYEPVALRVQLDGSSSKVVLHLKPAAPANDARNAATISVSQLQIPSKAREEYQRGLQSLAKNDLPEALKHFTKACMTYPSFYEAQYHVGVAHLKMGRHEEAMQAFQRAVDLSAGRYAPAELGVGALLYESGNSGEAEKVIRRGLELDDSLPEGYVLLGMVLLRERRPDEAERSAREALLRRATFAQAYLVLSDVHASRHDYRGQVQDLDAYLALEPKGLDHMRVVQARELLLHKLTGATLQAAVPVR